MNIILARLRTLLATISVKAGDVFEKDQVIQLNKLCTNGKITSVAIKNFNVSVVKEPVNSQTYRTSPTVDDFEKFLKNNDGNAKDLGDAILTQNVFKLFIERAHNSKKHFTQDGDDWFYHTGEGTKNQGKKYKLISKDLHLKQTAERRLCMYVDAVNVDNPSREPMVISFDGDFIVDWYAGVERQKDGENEGKYVATGECYPMLDTDKMTNIEYHANPKRDTSFKKTDDKQDTYGEETIKGFQKAIDDAIRGYATKFIEPNPDASEMRGSDGLQKDSIFSIGKALGMTEVKKQIKLKPDFVKFLKDELGKTDEEISKIDKFSNEFSDYARKSVLKAVKPKAEELIDALKALKENLSNYDSLSKEQVKSLEEKMCIFLNQEDLNGQIKSADGHNGQKAGYGPFCKWVLGISKKIKGISMTFDAFLDYCRSF